VNDPYTTGKKKQFTKEKAVIRNHNGKVRQINLLPPALDPLCIVM